MMAACWSWLNFSVSVFPIFRCVLQAARFFRELSSAMFPGIGYTGGQPLGLRTNRMLKRVCRAS